MCLFASFATHSFYSQIKHKSPIIWKESHNLKQRYISLLTNYQSPNHQQITSLWSALCLLSYQTPLTPTCSFFSYVLYLFFSSSGLMLSKKSTLPCVWNTKETILINDGIDLHGTDLLILARARGVPAVGVWAVNCWQWCSGHYLHPYFPFFSRFFPRFSSDTTFSHRRSARIKKVI